MQRSSSSIAALASALAKAQIELTNPEKSLVGTIEPRRGQGGARQFRYAPLSSGCLRIPRENGSPRTGRSVRSLRLNGRIAWERR
jgi:hypothetical protein